MDLVVVLVVIVGIFQLPFLIDVVNTFFPSHRIQRRFSALFSWLLRFSVVFIIWTTFFLFVDVWLWFYVETPLSPLGVLLTIPAFWTFFSSTFHFAVACFGEAGRLPDARLRPRPDADAGECKKCAAPKPDGVRHCSTCNRCVFFLDHHCPFTGNCCGWQNYVNFFLFLCFAAAGLLQGTVHSYFPFAKCVLGWHVPAGLNLVCSQMVQTQLVFVPMLCVTVCVSLLLFLECYLLCLNRSTLHWCTFLNRISSRNDLTFPPVFGAPTKTNYLVTRGRSVLALLHPLYRHPVESS